MRESNSRHSFLWKLSEAHPQSHSQGSDWSAGRRHLKVKPLREASPQLLGYLGGLIWGNKICPFGQLSMEGIYLQPRDPPWAEFWEEKPPIHLWGFPVENLGQWKGCELWCPRLKSQLCHFEKVSPLLWNSVSSYIMETVITWIISCSRICSEN